MPVITIARQFGAGGATVGRMLADRLKADFLDSEIIDEVARRLQLPKEEVEAEDEQPGSLLARLLVALGSASTEPLIPAEAASAWTPPNAAPTFDTRKAVLQITQHVIQEAARAGNVVIVGRGSAYILRDDLDALHVFLRASETARLKAIRERFGVGEEEARKRLKQTDENWTAYIRQVYGHDRTHPAHYDMVLDTGRLGYEGAVEVVLTALKARKPIT
jgi:cytidylate kinase